jgi:hypothetical protein
VKAVEVALAFEVAGEEFVGGFGDEMRPLELIVVVFENLELMVGVAVDPIKELGNGLVMIVNEGMVLERLEIGALTTGDGDGVDGGLPGDVVFFEEADVVVRPPAGVTNPLAKDEIFSGNANIVGLVGFGEVAEGGSEGAGDNFVCIEDEDPIARSLGDGEVAGGFDVAYSGMRVNFGAGFGSNFGSVVGRVHVDNYDLVGEALDGFEGTGEVRFFVECVDDYGNHNHGTWNMEYGTRNRNTGYKIQDSEFRS